MSDGRVKGDVPVSTSETTPQYRCVKCSQKFTADKVWTKNGQVICKSCYAMMPAQPTAAGKEKVSGTETVSKTDTVRRPRPTILLSKVTCPHCWHRFPPEQILWVSQHTELLGDLVLGPDAASRFLPTRFTVDGNALDSHGMQSQTLACPKCHLIIPRSLVETEPFLFPLLVYPRAASLIS